MLDVVLCYSGWYHMNLMALIYIHISIWSIQTSQGGKFEC